MQFKITTDYAIRIVTFLAMKNSICSSKEIADASNISQNYILKISRDLVSAGLIKQHRGVQGGFSIAKDPKDIFLNEILSVTEPTLRINRCLEDDKYCNRNATESCKIRKMYCRIQDSIDEFFSSISLQDLIDGKD